MASAGFSQMMLIELNGAGALTAVEAELNMPCPGYVLCTPEDLWEDISAELAARGGGGCAPDSRPAWARRVEGEKVREGLDPETARHEVAGLAVDLARRRTFPGAALVKVLVNVGLKYRKQDLRWYADALADVMAKYELVRRGRMVSLPPEKRWAQETIEAKHPLYREWDRKGRRFILPGDDPEPAVEAQEAVEMEPADEVASVGNAAQSVGDTRAEPVPVPQASTSLTTDERTRGAYIRLRKAGLHRPRKTKSGGAKRKRHITEAAMARAAGMARRTVQAWFKRDDQWLKEAERNAREQGWAVR